MPSTAGTVRAAAETDDDAIALQLASCYGFAGAPEAGNRGARTLRRSCRPARRDAWAHRTRAFGAAAARRPARRGRPRHHRQRKCADGRPVRAGDGAALPGPAAARQTAARAQLRRRRRPAPVRALPACARRTRLHERDRRRAGRADGPAASHVPAHRIHRHTGRMGRHVAARARLLVFVPDARRAVRLCAGARRLGGRLPVVPARARGRVARARVARRPSRRHAPHQPTGAGATKATRASIARPACATSRR